MKKPNQMKIMKPLNKFIFAFLFLPFCTLAQTNVVDKIVAKVDNHIILKSEVENAYQQALSSGEKLPKGKCSVLEQLVINKVLAAKAEIDSIEVEDVSVEMQLERRMQYMCQMYGSCEKLEKVLNTSTTDLKNDLRDQVKEQLMVQKMQGEIVNNIEITPAQVKKYFGSIPQDSIPFLSAEVQVGEIVRFPEINRQEKLRIKEKLLDIKTKILEGANFGELAKLYSEDYGSAKQGGELGWYGRGELAPEFEAVALSINEGEIADPIETEFGFHLIQLIERRGNRFSTRHILIRPKPSEDDIKRTIQKMDSIRTLIMKDSMSFEQAAKDYSEEVQTRSNASYFKDEMTGSSLVPTDALDASVFFVVDTMKVGSITKPFTFRHGQEGKTAIRMLYYKKYIPPHNANVKDDYQKLYTAALNAKKDEAIGTWLKTAVKEVFIDIDTEYTNCSILKELEE
jgi:peptidyl-prolyl cis-trans isomerase SurA